MRVARRIEPADRLRIESSVLAAERDTSGELVVAVVRACDAYGSPGWRLGVWLALFAVAGLGVFVPATPLAGLLGAQLAALLLGHALARLDPVRRRLVSAALSHARAAERAHRAFAETGLSRTPGRTGVLLFVALFERRVIVLGDEGIAGALDPEESFDDVVAEAVDDLRRGCATDGIVAAVERVGSFFARHLPAGPRDPSALPTPVVFEE